MIRHKKSVWDRLPQSDIPVPKFIFPFFDYGCGGDALIKFNNISFEYSVLCPILEDVSLSVHAGDIIGIVGNNGSGKTTFLKLLDESLQPTNGYIERRRAFSIAKLDQHHIDHFNFTISPIELFHQKFGLSSHDSRTYLARFRLNGILPTRKIGSLSGGEKTRLAIAEILYLKPYILLLDEPTNYLDLESIQSLAEGIKASNGVFIIVSHNQYFLKMVVNVLWVIKDRNVSLYDGDFDQYKQEIIDELDL